MAETDLPHSIPVPSDGREVILVSACLLGVPCNHRGEASLSQSIAGLAEKYHLVPCCPEVLGGLSVPRPPAEIEVDRTGQQVLDGEASVLSDDGENVSGAYRLGAQRSVALAIANDARTAILKARSPSCGADQVYDGTFTKSLTQGWGVAATALRAAGVAVYSDEEIAQGERQLPTFGD